MSGKLFWYERYLHRHRAIKRPEPMSFEEIGRKMGLTSEYVGVLYRSALRKLKTAMEQMR